MNRTEQQGDPVGIVQRYNTRRPINEFEARFFVEIVKLQPQIIERVRDLALTAIRAGHRYYGMRGILEVLRWSMINDKSKQTGINDHHRPYLRRWLLETTPELPPNFFKMRPIEERRADLDEVQVWLKVWEVIEQEERASAV